MELKIDILVQYQIFKMDILANSFQNLTIKYIGKILEESRETFIVKNSNCALSWEILKITLACFYTLFLIFFFPFCNCSWDDLSLLMHFVFNQCKHKLLNLNIFLKKSLNKICMIY